MATGLVLTAPRTFERRTFPLPDIGDGDALLRVEACGLCGTDHEQYTGLLFGGFAFIPGHETVGIIEEIGDAAAERWSVAAGDRVAVECFQACRECDACTNGQYRQCKRHGLRDMYGFIGVDTPPALWGGYATHHYLGPDSMLLPVPPDLDPVMATLFNPVGAGIRWGVTVPGTRAGDVVAVLGPGIRGISAAAAAKAAGAAFVLVTGYGDRDRARLETALTFGADAVVDVARDDPVRALREHVGHLADVVVDVTAKAPTALGQAVSLARAGGTIVLAGTRGSPETPGFDPDLIVYKELRVLGALGVDVEEHVSALSLVEHEDYPFADLPRRIADLDGAEALLRTMAGETDEAPPVHGVVVP